MKMSRCYSQKVGAESVDTFSLKPGPESPGNQGFFGKLRDTLPFVFASVPLLAAAVCFTFSFPAAGFGTIGLTGNRKIGRTADRAGLTGKYRGVSG